MKFTLIDSTCDDAVDALTQTELARANIPCFGVFRQGSATRPSHPNDICGTAIGILRYNNGATTVFARSKRAWIYHDSSGSTGNVSCDFDLSAISAEFDRRRGERAADTCPIEGDTLFLIGKFGCYSRKQPVYRPNSASKRDLAIALVDAIRQVPRAFVPSIDEVLAADAEALETGIALLSHRSPQVLAISKELVRMAKGEAARLQQLLESSSSLSFGHEVEILERTERAKRMIVKGLPIARAGAPGLDKELESLKKSLELLGLRLLRKYEYYAREREFKLSDCLKENAQTDLCREDWRVASHHMQLATTYWRMAGVAKRIGLEMLRDQCTSRLNAHLDRLSQEQRQSCEYQRDTMTLG
jgi:hypothetical protein